MCFLPLKSSHYPSRPVPVPELFGKYPTRPVPKSKTPTRQTLIFTHDVFDISDKNKTSFQLQTSSPSVPCDWNGMRSWNMACGAEQAPGEY